MYDGAGHLVADTFPGYYTYSTQEHSPSSVSSTLATSTPPSATIVTSQTAGYTNIEVDDASLWPSAPYSVKVGRGSGHEEDAELSDITLAVSTSSTLASGASIGDTSITLAASAGFPETDVPNRAGYRVVIDKGNAGEEFVKILDNDTGTGVLTCEALTKAHSSSVAVNLANDTLTFDSLSKNHAGPSVSPSKSGQLVEKLVGIIDLVSSTGFSNSGTVIINYGNEIIPVRTKITSVISTTVYGFSNTSVFPTTNLPYQVVLGQGLTTEEVVNVSVNNTGTNRLTVSSPIYTHFAGEYVEFKVESPEVVEYQDVDGNSLQFIPPIVLNKHIIGERVMVTNGYSVPVTTGFGYAFRLPPDPFVCLHNMFDIIRGAGIKVTIVTER